MEESLLIKYINGACTPDEEKEVAVWLEKPGRMEELNALLEKHWENDYPEILVSSDYDRILAGIHRKINDKRRAERPSWGKVFRLAASISLILFCAFLFREGMLYHKKYPKEQSRTAVRQVVRETGMGEKLILALSDGTKITVNANSEISFTIPLGIDERAIRLKGEAFFEIAKDTLRPFRVYTEELVTTALGTQFNVFARETTVQVALMEGKVKVVGREEYVELNPGQMAVKDRGMLSVAEFDAGEVMAWKEGRLVFDRRPLGLILDDLAKWYGVDMHIDNAVDRKRKVTGTFQNKNLRDIMEGLSFSIGFKYQISGKQVTIK